MTNIYLFAHSIFVKHLKALDGLLVKARSFVAEKGMEENKLVNEQLIADMFPLKKQVQVACDNAKNSLARLAGLEAPAFEDNEQTISELHARIQKTLEYLATFSEASFQNAAEQKITLPYFPGKYFEAMDYVREYALPNFFFHVTIAYAILRKEGVPIGKTDFMIGFPLKDL